MEMPKGVLHIGCSKHVIFHRSGRLTGSLLQGYCVCCHCHFITGPKLLVCGLGFLCVIKMHAKYFCLANEVNAKLEFPGHTILMSSNISLTFIPHMFVIIKQLKIYTLICTLTP